nr:MAG TPA: hypothetical protein [Caudoviricetes sp.]
MIQTQHFALVNDHLSVCISFTGANIDHENCRKKY